MKPLFEVNNGKIAFANSIEQDFCDYIIDKTKNLLKTATVSSFFIDYILDWKDKKWMCQFSKDYGYYMQQSKTG